MRPSGYLYAQHIVYLSVVCNLVISSTEFNQFFTNISSWTRTENGRVVYINTHFEYLESFTFKCQLEPLSVSDCGKNPSGRSFLVICQLNILTALPDKLLDGRQIQIVAQNLDKFRRMKHKLGQAKQAERARKSARSTIGIGRQGPLWQDRGRASDLAIAEQLDTFGLDSLRL